LDADKEDSGWNSDDDVEKDIDDEDADAGARGDVRFGGESEELGDELDGGGPDEDGGDGLIGLSPGGLAVAGPPVGGFWGGDHDAMWC